MRVKRQSDRVVITLNLLESRVLLRVFQALDASYKVKPADLDSKAASAWYSTRGCASVRMTAVETQDWLDHLHALKGMRLAHLEEWSRQLGGTGTADFRITVETANAGVFLAILNDYRLLMAAHHDIGEAEMDLRVPDEWSSLLPARQRALFEIHFLAWMLEEILHELPEG